METGLGWGEHTNPTLLVSSHSFACVCVFSRMTPFECIADCAAGDRRPGTVGLPLPGVQVTVKASEAGDDPAEGVTEGGHSTQWLCWMACS